MPNQHVIPVLLSAFCVLALSALSFWRTKRARWLIGQWTGWRKDPAVSDGERRELLRAMTRLPTWRFPAHAIVHGSAADGPRLNLPNKFDVQLAMTVLVTLAILGAALFIILSDHYGQDSLKWAYASVGTVVGYWLKR